MNEHVSLRTMKVGVVSLRFSKISCWVAEARLIAGSRSESFWRLT